MRVPTVCPACPREEILVYAEIKVLKGYEAVLKCEYLCRHWHEFDVDKADLDELTVWFNEKNTVDHGIFKKKEE